MKITFQRLNYTTLYFLDFIKLRTILDNQHLYKNTAGHLVPADFQLFII